ncbi:MAG: hypothetical protein Q8S94_08445 [Pseudohongiella sp.]|jgi:hypothetical protein|nr:hypothetical protein [Pseudohongiella sp.]MDP2285811.1 hypothetical protein [Pseudohongiella sp.]MDP3517182.1 hypothetical protein [Pseudohongiella sp.]
MNNSQLYGFIKSARHPLAILSVSVLASACITAEEVSQRQASRMPTPAEVEQYNASVSPDERIVCRNEIPVGSNIPVRKCRLMIDIDETSTFHREQLRRALR